jgi:imidazolonepropionase
MSDTLLRGVHLATMTTGGAPYGTVRDGAIGITGGRIAFAGPEADLPDDAQAQDERDGGGAWVFPGFVDCHTHIVFGGTRAREFEERLKGVSYEEIAKRGGGILSTVKSTRAASEEALTESALKRLKRLKADGVTTVEIKSGYGLTLEDELKMLRAARAAARQAGMSVQTTFLGAHALPPEFTGDKDGYIAHVCDVMIPAVADAGLANAVDAFCEGIAFTPDQTARVFKAAANHGLKVKLHADQLSDTSGGWLAAQHSALSADHLEYAGAATVRAMAEAGTVAVLLPGAFYALGETRRPPVEMLRAAGVPMALATDANPGSSPVLSVQLMLHMGCTLFGMTAEEAIAGITRCGAAALGLLADRGTLEVGKRADILLFDIEGPAELAYFIGGVPPREILSQGCRTQFGAAGVRHSVRTASVAVRPLFFIGPACAGQPALILLNIGRQRIKYCQDLRHCLKRPPVRCVQEDDHPVARAAVIIGDGQFGPVETAMPDHNSVLIPKDIEPKAVALLHRAWHPTGLITPNHSVLPFIRRDAIALCRKGLRIPLCIHDGNQEGAIIRHGGCHVIRGRKTSVLPAPAAGPAIIAMEFAVFVDRSGQGLRLVPAHLEGRVRHPHGAENSFCNQRREFTAQLARCKTGHIVKSLA